MQKVNVHAVKKGKAGRFSVENQGKWYKNTTLIAVLFVTVVLTLTAYRRAFDNEFVDWDDFTYVVNNNLVRSQADTVLDDIFSTPVSSNYHPLTILSLRLNNNSCQTCQNGISPTPFIMWNIILHLVNTVLVFLLVYMLSGKKVFASFFVAAVFGVHPLHVESVAWISERKDVLYSFFFLSGLLSYLAFKDATRSIYKALFYVLTFILFVFSCLSKAVAVVFPLVLVLIDYWKEPHFDKANILQVIKKWTDLQRILLILPFLIVSLFTGLLAYHLQNGENFLGLMRIDKNLPDVVNTIRKLTVFQRIGVGCSGLVSYLIKFFLPFKLSAIYPYPPEEVMKSAGYITGMAASTLITIAVTSVALMKKTKILPFGTAFFFITIMLVLQFISVGIAIKADRYTYIPYIGLAFIPAMLIEEKLRGGTKKRMVIISCLFVIFLWFLTSRQIDVWQNTETLWTDVIKKYPEAETPRASRGKFYTRKSLNAKSISEKAYFEEKAMADFMVAVRVKTKNTDVYEGIGYILASRGDYKKALEYFDLAIIADQQNGSAYYNRALVYTSLNMPEEAIKDYTTALKYSPEKKREIITNRSNLLLETGRFREVIPDLDYLISLEPSNSNHYFNRATARLLTGDIQGAESDLRQVLRLNPADREVLELLQKIHLR